MKRLLPLLVIALSACAGIAGGPTPQPEAGVAGEVLALVNPARSEEQDCGSRGSFAPAAALQLDAKLTSAAQKHSEDMEAAGEMSHATPEGAVHYPAGSSPWERLEAEGYSFSAAGENVAWGYSSPERVVAGWLASDPHCANIMNPTFSELGVGRAGTYWTQDFAKP